MANAQRDIGGQVMIDTMPAPQMLHTGVVRMYEDIATLIKVLASEPERD